MSVLARLAKLEQQAEEAQPGEPILIFLRYEGDADGDDNVLFRLTVNGARRLVTKAELDAMNFPRGSITCVERVVRTREEALQDTETAV